jgi:hypothetical protein
MSEQYPEHEKLTAISDKSQACYDFLEWLGEQGIMLGKYDVAEDFCRNCEHPYTHDQRVANPTYFGQRTCSYQDDITSEWCRCDDSDFGNPDRFYPYLTRREELLADHFGIDLRLIEKEKRAMLDTMRRMNS